MIEIADRRNELAGNLSLNQELHFIEKIDQLLEDRRARARTAATGRIVVRVLELSRDPLSRARSGPASKLNRDPAFLAELMAHGEARAGEFLAALAFEDAWMRRDVEAPSRRSSPRTPMLDSAAPFPAHRLRPRTRAMPRASCATTSPTRS